MIRPVQQKDASAICDIYNLYIDDTWITFEEVRVTEKEMVARIKEISPKYPWLVYEDAGNVLGYTYANRWKERSAYRHALEIAIYLNTKKLGMGIGSKLLEDLLGILKKQKYHSAIYGISLPNTASIALCEKYGFKKIALFKEVGYKLGKWIDVGYWELLL